MTVSASSRVVINLSAYAHNLKTVHTLAGEKPGIIAVLKANAYGHGLVPVAQRAVQCGVRMLGVATVEEGAQLRDAGLDIPILVMVQPTHDQLAQAIEYRLTLMLSDIEIIELLADIAHKANRVAHIHCKIDSGMGRQGFSIDTAPERLQYVTRISHVDIEGVATHFPAAEQPDDAFTHNQIRGFRHLLKLIDKWGIPYEMAHAANSAGIVNYRSSTFDAVRPGLMTYGIWPGKNSPPQHRLERVLRWESTVALVRDLEPGSSVGYGRTYTTTARMRAAMIPVGYADGYKHALSNKAHVLIHGIRCPVRGSVCMDQIIVDISGVPQTQPGDTATLIGSDGKEIITVEELANLSGTIPYDILTSIGNRVSRVYVD